MRCLLIAVAVLVLLVGLTVATVALMVRAVVIQ